MRCRGPEQGARYTSHQYHSVLVCSRLVGRWIIAKVSTGFFLTLSNTRTAFYTGASISMQYISLAPYGNLWQPPLLYARCNVDASTTGVTSTRSSYHVALHRVSRRGGVDRVSHLGRERFGATGQSLGRHVHRAAVIHRVLEPDRAALVACHSWFCPMLVEISFYTGACVYFYAIHCARALRQHPLLYTGYHVNAVS